jgi:RHS repeat-associated protein
LLAEYNGAGECVKEYIYLGSKLAAEYSPPDNQFYYYTTDQINSSKLITDDSGTVVYHAAHGPYGDIQKTFINTKDPNPKFSGKEREAYSNLDYFGARYYSSRTARFDAIDPIMNKDEAMSNTQLWNLYAYCGNNPVNYIDKALLPNKSGPRVYVEKYGLIDKFLGDDNYYGSFNPITKNISIKPKAFSSSQSSLSNQLAKVIRELPVRERVKYLLVVSHE